ncbi:hypothetical protein GW17_00062440 [Ensete ventricosum]|nr:hypothetical protein GW17_00062440 [Ensete ventricosum]
MDRSVARGGSSCPRAWLVTASQSGRQPTAGTTACSAAPAKGAGCKVRARGYCPQLALPPAGAAAPAVGRGKEGLGHPLEKRMILPL